MSALFTASLSPEADTDQERQKKMNSTVSWRCDALTYSDPQLPVGVSPARRINFERNSSGATGDAKNEMEGTEKEEQPSSSHQNAVGEHAMRRQSLSSSSRPWPADHPFLTDCMYQCWCFQPSPLNGGVSLCRHAVLHLTTRAMITDLAELLRQEHWAFEGEIVAAFRRSWSDLLSTGGQRGRLRKQQQEGWIRELVLARERERECGSQKEGMC